MIIQQQNRRRLATCRHHPSGDNAAGVCSSCLRDRLSFIQSPSHSSSVPDLRRCSSYVHGSLRGGDELRRKSCDSRPRSSLSHLFRADDSPGRAIVIESEKLGFLGGEKGFDDNEAEQEAEDHEEEGKTMKEHIELEFELRSKRSGGLWGGAASVFGQKLQKWRLKQHDRKGKKESRRPRVPHGVEAEGLMIGRKSCDTERRFSVDAGRISMDDPPRFSLDEPRASWDGYMVARTIPRLAPMLSVIENVIVAEDETNSVSESSSSRRRNSFDCSSSGKSSGKHRMPVEIELPKESPVAKIFDTGTDKAHLDFSPHDDPSKRSPSGSKNADSLKKRVLRILGFKSKFTDSGHGKVEVDLDCSGKQIGGGNGLPNVASNGKVVGRNSYSYHRSPNGAEIRGPATSFERRSMRYSPSSSSFDNGLLRFHLAPPLSRKKKPERRSVLNSHSNARGASWLN